MVLAKKGKKNGANDRIRQGGQSPTQSLNAVKATAPLVRIAIGSKRANEQSGETKTWMTAKFILPSQSRVCREAILTVLAKKGKKKWSQWPDSNRWPIHYEWIALPAEPHWHLVYIIYPPFAYFSRAMEGIFLKMLFFTYFFSLASASSAALSTGAGLGPALCLTLKAGFKSTFGLSLETLILSSPRRLR